MADIITREGTLPASVVAEMFNAVQGHSSLAKLSTEKPMPFNGVTEFVFDLDNEVDIVAENGPKSNGGGTVSAVSIVPIKFEYGMRVSDEFLKGSEEYQLDVTERFIEGFAKKLGRGIDIGAMHGINPRTGQPSDVIGDNHFDKKVTNVAPYDATAPDDSLDEAVGKVSAGNVNGMALGKTMANAMASLKVNGVAQYPEFRFGRNPEDFYGMRSDVNSTVEFGDVDYAIVGDFNAFRWGYGQDIELEVIRYGNPDNNTDLGDLRGHNQVYLRCEAYVGWGILSKDAFARVSNEGESE